MWNTYHLEHSNGRFIVRQAQQTALKISENELRKSLRELGQLLQSAHQIRSKGNITLLLEGHFAVLALPLVLGEVYEHVGLNAHILLRLEAYLSEDFWTMLKPLYKGWGVAERALDWLATRDVVPVPGIQRFDFGHNGGSLTLAFSKEENFSRQWIAGIDGYVRWQVGQKGAEVCAQHKKPELYLKKARPESYLISNMDAEESLAAHLRQVGIHVEEICTAVDGTGSPASVASVGGSASAAADSASSPVTPPNSPARLYRLRSQRPAAGFNPYPTIRSAAIIGAGLAAAGVADALRRRGWRVSIFDEAQQQSKSSRHYNHRAAAMIPYASADDNFKSRLSRLAILRAHDCWPDLPDHVLLSRGALALDTPFGYGQNLCSGVRRQQFSEKWVSLHSAADLSEMLGRQEDAPGVKWHYAWQLSPQELIPHLLSHPAITVTPNNIDLLKQHNGFWQLYSCGKYLGSYAHVILANAADSVRLLRNSGLDKTTGRRGNSKDPMPKINQSTYIQGGQVIHVPEHSFGAAPRMMIDRQGYLLPPANGCCVVGSSYQKNEREPEISEAQQTAILQKTGTYEELKADLPYPGWSGHRAVVQDRLPVISPLKYAPGLWLAMAYGSHGLSWSCLGGELIAAALCDEPLPIEYPLWQAISAR